jgi:molybdopterin converting factor subunit 1
MARILYFGKLSSIFGEMSETADLPASISDTAALRTWIDQTRGFDGVLLHPSIRIAVNNEIVPDPSPVSDTDEIAFMPPVGGG